MVDDSGRRTKEGEGRSDDRPDSYVEGCPLPVCMHSWALKLMTYAQDSVPNVEGTPIDLNAYQSNVCQIC